MEVLPLSLTQSEQKVNQHRSSTDKRLERRKPNWTECENVFLLDQFSLHREILTCKATDASTNLRKQEVWRIICQNLNKQNVQVRRTPAEVRRKWKNLVTAAKKEVWEIRHQAHVTGATRKLSELSQRVLQLHSTTASAVALFMSRETHGHGHGHHGVGVGMSMLEDSMSMSSRPYSRNRSPSRSRSPSPSPTSGDFDRSMNGYYGNGGGSNGIGLASHFTPIVQFSESVSSPTGSGTGSCSGEENFDSRMYAEDDAAHVVHDLRVKKEALDLNMNIVKVERNISEASDEIQKLNEDLVRDKLELQIEVFRLRKRKLEIEIRRLGRGRSRPARVWRMKTARLLK